MCKEHEKAVHQKGDTNGLKTNEKVINLPKSAN